jgi:hypothetical protein
MIVQARCGLRREAAQIAQELRQESPNNPSLLFQIACCYALCVPGAPGRSSAPARAAGNPDEMPRDLGKDALDALRLAVGAGYKDVTAIEHDPDLDPIRDRADFQEFLEALKSASKTNGQERPRPC